MCVCVFKINTVDYICAYYIEINNKSLQNMNIERETPRAKNK